MSEIAPVAFVCACPVHGVQIVGGAKPGDNCPRCWKKGKGVKTPLTQASSSLFNSKTRQLLKHYRDRRNKDANARRSKQNAKRRRAASENDYRTKFEREP